MKNLIELDHYCQIWSLSGAEKIAETPTSHVYRVAFGQSQAVLKILTPLGKEDERFGACALQCFDGNGAVRLLRRDNHAHLLEFIEGPDLTPMVKDGKDVEATSIVADTLNKMHVGAGTPTEPLPSLRDRFWSLYSAAKGQQDAIYSAAALMADQLLEGSRDQVILHGDVHHENILHSKTRGWLAIDPKGIPPKRRHLLVASYDLPKGVEHHDARQQETAIGTQDC